MVRIAQIQNKAAGKISDFSGHIARKIAGLMAATIRLEAARSHAAASTLSVLPFYRPGEGALNALKEQVEVFKITARAIQILLKSAAAVIPVLLAWRMIRTNRAARWFRHAPSLGHPISGGHLLLGSLGAVGGRMYFVVSAGVQKSKESEPDEWIAATKIGVTIALARGV